MNIKIGILNVPKHDNKHDLIHFVTLSLFDTMKQYDAILYDRFLTITLGASSLKVVSKVSTGFMTGLLKTNI